MKKISIINLKGGVGKTMSSINIAHILATVYKKRVLIIDNDKQGNTTKFFNKHEEEDYSISDLLTNRCSIDEVILKTGFENLDLIPANMSLAKANLEIIKDETSPQPFRLKNHLEEIEEEYDYCVIDNPPDINISAINARTCFL